MAKLSPNLLKFLIQRSKNPKKSTQDKYYHQIAENKQEKNLTQSEKKGKLYTGEQKLRMTPDLLLETIQDR